MALEFLIPMLTGTLGSILFEVGGSKVGKLTLNKSKGLVNRIAKKLGKEKPFKKKLLELSVDEYKTEIEKLLKEALKTFNKAALSELKAEIPNVNDIKTVLKTTVSQVTEQITQIGSDNQELLRLMKETIENKAQYIPEMYFDYRWHNSLERELEQATQQNLKLVSSVQIQFREFSENFEAIFDDLTFIKKRIEQGFKAGQEGHSKTQRLVKQILHKLLQEFGKSKIKEKRLLELSALHIGRHQNFRSESDITFQPEKYVERTAENQVEKAINKFLSQRPYSSRFFLLLGEAGTGKTWLLTKIALEYVDKGHPVFFITLRETITRSLDLIFGYQKEFVNRQLINLQNDEKNPLSKPLILIFDGYDEIYERSDKDTLIFSYLRELPQNWKKTLIIISSRYFDWFKDETTGNGKTDIIINNLWKEPHQSKPYSYNLEKFTVKERDNAIKKYKSDKIPDIENWENELKDVALLPIWTRLICEQFIQGKSASFKSTELYNAYFQRVSIKDIHYLLIAEITEELIINEKKLSDKISIHSEVFKNKETQLNELTSKNILIEPKGRDGEKDETYREFMTTQFCIYGLAHELWLRAHKLEQTDNIARKQRLQDNLDHHIDLINKLPEEQRTIIQNLGNQITRDKHHNFDVKTYFQTAENAEIKQAKRNQSPPPKIAKDNLIAVKDVISSIEEIQLIHQTREITLEEFSDHLKCDVELAKKALYHAIVKRRIQVKYKNNNEPKNIEWHSFELNDNWNLEKRIQIKLKNVYNLLQEPTSEKLNKANKLLQELEVYKLQEEEINTKQQLITKISIQGKFIRSIDLLNNITPQNLKQAREILLKLEDSKLKQQDIVKKQNLLLRISNELDKIQAKKEERNNAKKEIKRLAENGELVNAKIKEFKSKYKMYLTKVDLEFLEMYTSEEYCGILLQAKEKMVLKQLEQMFGTQIPLAKEITESTFGYVAKGTIITGLGLYDQGLSFLPESISSLQKLQFLSLANNALSFLPESISSLHNLRELSLSNNQLFSLPESISSLKNLQELYLDNNKLSSLPENVEDALRKLEENGCQIYR